MTISKAMNIALTGLNANQAALNVVSHNIANMNTEGYVKQRVNFAEVRTPVSDNTTVHGQIASLSGVRIDSLTNYTNDYLNNYYRKQNSDYEGLLEDANTAAQLSGLLDEMTGSGLINTLSDFFSAAGSLSNNPTDYSLRVNFAEKTKAVANKFNYTYKNISDLKTSKVGDGTLQSAADSELGQLTDSVNDNLVQLANVNKQMTISGGDGSLKSKQEQILTELTKSADFTISFSASGAANVKLGNTDLVLGSENVASLQVGANASISAIDADGHVKDVTSDIKGGKIGGLLGGLSGINEALSGLDELANSFAGLINGIQTYSDGDVNACYYDRANGVLAKVSDSTDDLNIFVASDGSGNITAANIKINDVVYKDPDKIAAARLDTSGTDWDLSVGNGDNAIEFVNAQNQKITSKNLKINDYLIGMSVKAGADASAKAADADAKGAVVDDIKNQILAESGVNLDEELTNMIMYQQAYNASARVFACCVQVYDTLLGLGT